MKKFFLMIALLLMPVTAPIIVCPVQVQAYGGRMNKDMKWDTELG